ncbi:porin [Corynebacterium sp. UMB6689]|nr:porin [Corynebacterium sp. UMB6689]MDK6813301.1 porin [Corynebacterium sp. UMB6689]
MGILSSTGIIGDILSVLYSLGDMASGASKLIGLL